GDISFFFKPRSVAVIGASREFGKPGNQVVANLLQLGYEGNIYPVNPRASEIYGLRAYPSIKDVPDDVEVAIIAVPSRFVPQAVKECAEKGVKGAVILSGGFSEGWDYGKEIEREVVEIARSSGMRLIGPNTMGVLDAYNKFTSFFSFLLRVKEGNVGVIAQSGAFANFSLLYLQHIGVSRVIALGNTCDVTEYEALDFLAKDEKTKVIAVYLEGFTNGRAFYEVLRNCRKPVVILKAGRTEAGKRSALSHTASLSTSDEVFAAACRQAGAVKVRDFEELVDAVKAMSLQPPPKGDRVGVIEPSGAECVMAADAVEEEGLRLAKYSERTVRKLYELVPEWHSVNNPLDLYPFLEQRGREVYKDVVRIFLEDENIDAVICGVFIPLFMDGKFDLSWLKGYDKPVFFTLKYEVEELMKLRRSIEEQGFPVYPTPERAVRALRHMLECSSE
ncbi:MAG: CoA-binding protein, partial [Archaeoglobaceae archaeon]